MAGVRIAVRVVMHSRFRKIRSFAGEPLVDMVSEYRARARTVIFGQTEYFGGDYYTLLGLVKPRLAVKLFVFAVARYKRNRIGLAF